LPETLKPAALKSSNLKSVLRVTSLNHESSKDAAPEWPLPDGPVRTYASPWRRMRSVFFTISIMLSVANPHDVAAQQVTNAAPLSAAAQQAANPAEPLPNAPSAVEYPDAVAVTSAPIDVHISAATESLSSAGLDVLDGGVVIVYRDRTLHADHMEYDRATGDVTLTGHIDIIVADSDEHIQASHGTFNVHTGEGRFYDVAGSVGVRQKPPDAAAEVTARAVYANGNPFLFTGRMVARTGPREFQVFGGTVTSCRRDRPDWLLSGGEFSISGNKASARNSVFRLLGVPVLWMPYVTHPVDASDRQTGFLIPEIGINSKAKGDTIGEQVYWAINRSTDITLGTIYYSKRGWEQTASLRHRGLGPDFYRAHYNGLQDRGYFPGGGTVKVDQSGTDVTFSGRHDLSASDDGNPPPVQSRMVADLEYLSSFTYREAFSSNFNQAVSSNVLSTVYVTREWNGMAVALEGDRYQSEKRVANSTSVPPQVEQQVRIFHAPALEFSAIDHRLGTTGFEWSLESSLAAMKRVQPNFESSGMVVRLDLRPQLAYPFGGDGWRIRPSVGARETLYSRSRFPAVVGIAVPPKENLAALNRGGLELSMDIRPPVLERTFTAGFLRNLLGRDVRHSIEPQLVYRFASGDRSFASTLRFDTVDVASSTNELEYGVTQRLFLKRRADAPCRTLGDTADVSEPLRAAGQPGERIEDPGESLEHVLPSEPVCGDREWINWRVAQKYFFDSTFGGAVIANGPRSILESTMDFSGISFLTGPRNISPIVSRLRVRTSDKTDLEWDFDFDTCSTTASATVPSNAARECQRKFTSNNIDIDIHQGKISSGIGYARLNAPARSYVDGVLSSVADFDQMRLHLGFGNPARPGPSAAASAGIDIDLGTVQYAALQISYNWNCCGFSAEYRKYELGTARNDNGYKFNFTLANIGSAGNIKHSDQVF
jgi:LPS-assembly protein